MFCPGPVAFRRHQPLVSRPRTDRGKRVTAVHATRLVSRPRLAADLHATDRSRPRGIYLFGWLVAGIQTCRWLSIGVRSIFAPVFACESCWRCRQADTAVATRRHERVACVDSVAAACARVCLLPRSPTCDFLWFPPLRASSCRKRAFDDDWCFVDANFGM